MGSSLWERLCINPMTSSSWAAELRWIWSCFCLWLGFDENLLVVSFKLKSVPLKDESFPPDRMSTANRKSSRTCRTPFSDTWGTRSSNEDMKSPYIPNTYKIMWKSMNVIEYRMIKWSQVTRKIIVVHTRSFAEGIATGMLEYNRNKPKSIKQ